MSVCPVAADVAAGVELSSDANLDPRKAYIAAVISKFEGCAGLRLWSERH